MLARYAERIRAAAGSGGCLRLRGGGTKDFYGGPLQGEVLDTRDYAGIVSYEPSELVLTARCGTPLAELESELAARHQILAFEPPRYGAGGTLGGCIAAGLAGPRRAANGLYYGGVRDHVLGCTLMDGRADTLRFGGQVMKNVAGYDVSRLAAGSMGTLGVLLEVSLKVLPAPVATATLRFSLDAETAVRRLNEWGGRPLPISASAWCAGVLNLRLEGAAAAVDSACATLGGDRVDPAQSASYWQAIRDHADPFFAPPGPLWRVSLPSTAPAIDLPRAVAPSQLIEWGGALRWVKTDDQGESIREAARKAGGHAALFRGGDRTPALFDAKHDVLARLHKNVKSVFDPAGVFNRGRLCAQW